ncbi:MAG: TerB family tellurite resistance protein [Myxococcales bacterium]|jgi:tellurite resistance protein
MDRPNESQLLAFARVMANLVAADGRVQPEEREELERVIQGVGLSPDDERVASMLEAELKSPSPLAEIAKDVEEKELRGLLLRMMAELACVDGEVAAEERAKVCEAATLFGFEPAIADELVTWVLDSIAVEKREQDLMSRLMK